MVHQTGLVPTPKGGFSQDPSDSDTVRGPVVHPRNTRFQQSIQLLFGGRGWGYKYPKTVHSTQQSPLELCFIPKHKCNTFKPFRENWAPNLSRDSHSRECVLLWYAFVVLCCCVLVLVLLVLFVKASERLRVVDCLAETLSHNIEDPRARAWSFGLLVRVERDPILRDTSTEM
jgi:hypothetical protein